MLIEDLLIPDERQHSILGTTLIQALADHRVSQACCTRQNHLRGFLGAILDGSVLVGMTVEDLPSNAGAGDSVQDSSSFIYYQ